MFDLEKIQKSLQDTGCQAWLIYDFRATNPIWKRLVGRTLWTTRRVFVGIPQHGEARALVHKVDSEQFTDFPGTVELFTNYVEMEAKLSDWCSRWHQTVAMEYCPFSSIPTMSIVDAGTMELLHRIGFSVTSSADLVQWLTARWSDRAKNKHLITAEIVNSVKDAAFHRIGDALRGGETITDFDVQQFIRNAFQTHNLEEEDVPIVSTNERSGNPHYAPSSDLRFTIDPGDWILIDLWAREPGEEHVFSDITWTGYAGTDVPGKHFDVFNAVLSGRDAALSLVEERYRHNQPVYGWEVDDAARNAISSRGYGEFFIHRTGHSLSPGDHVHGIGANIDNFETHDTRRLITRTGFTIEPGIYLPEFGVRSEINVYLDPSGPCVTSHIQREVVLVV